MKTQQQLVDRLLEIVTEIADDVAEINADSMLIGDKAVIESRQLVEILLAVEELAEDDLGVTFDWSSDAAMSKRKSPYRTINVLAAHLLSLTTEA